MAGHSEEPEEKKWQRSLIGVTPLRLRPRPGRAHVRKLDIVGKTQPGQADQQRAFTTEQQAPGMAVAAPRVSEHLGRQEKGIPLSSRQRVCSVCARANADYSCPRCLIGYCSSTCYKTHGSGCTEAFFRDHVERETKFREAEGTSGDSKSTRRARMVDLLGRVRSADNSHGQAVNGAGLVDADGSAMTAHDEQEAWEEGQVRLTQERLEALALSLTVRPRGDGDVRGAGADQTHLEQQRREDLTTARTSGVEQGLSGTLDREGEDIDEGVMDLLTSEERARFLREVHSGRLGRLIAPWVPWWTRTGSVQELAPGEHRSSHSWPLPAPVPAAVSFASKGSSGLSASQGPSSPTEPPTPEHPRRPIPDVSSNRTVTESPTSVESDSDTECSRHAFTVLLQKAKDAPDFETLCAREPSPTLPALAADIAYAYASTARLYNGCWCADPVGASLALVGSSPVLRDRATPPTVGEALRDCVARAVENEGVACRGYAESLREDVALLCSDHRKLVCAFQDAWSMLEAAGRALAPSNAGRSVNTKKGQRKAAKDLGKVEKRVSYFLLWARSHGAEAAPRIAATVRAGAFTPPVMTAASKSSGGGDCLLQTPEKQGTVVAPVGVVRRARSARGRRTADGTRAGRGGDEASNRGSLLVQEL